MISISKLSQLIFTDVLFTVDNLDEMYTILIMIILPVAFFLTASLSSQLWDECIRKLALPSAPGHDNIMQNGRGISSMTATVAEGSDGLAWCLIDRVDGSA